MILVISVTPSPSGICISIRVDNMLISLSAIYNWSWLKTFLKMIINSMVEPFILSAFILNEKPENIVRCSFLCILLIISIINKIIVGFMLNVYNI